MCLRLGKERSIVMRFDILKGLFSDQGRNEALHFKRDFQLKILIGPHLQCFKSSLGTI